METVYTARYQKLPENLADLKVYPGSDLLSAHQVAALTICALEVYPKNPEESIAMLQYLSGPRDITNYDKQFLQDRFRGKDYVVRSFFQGATPENNYTPEVPYSIAILESPYSRDQLGEGYLVLYVQSSGADSPRQIKLRHKESTGQWFLWEQMVLGDIRIPKEQDPWA